MLQQPPSDADLLASIKNDDASAFKILYDRYWERLYIQACKRIDKDEAKDMVQEVMTTLWRRRKEVVTQQEGIGRYLHSAVKYRVISHYAYTASEIHNNHLFEVLESHSLVQSVETKELNEVLEAAISRLPARMQQVFRLSREDDFSIADIARQLNLSEQTIKNQLTEALKRIRESVRSNDYGDWTFILILLYCTTR